MSDFLKNRSLDLFQFSFLGRECLSRLLLILKRLFLLNIGEFLLQLKGNRKYHGTRERRELPPVRSCWKYITKLKLLLGWGRGVVTANGSGNIFAGCFHGAFNGRT